VRFYFFIAGILLSSLAFAGIEKQEPSPQTDKPSIAPPDLMLLRRTDGNPAPANKFEALRQRAEHGDANAQFLIGLSYCHAMDYKSD
jgi:hypothetical protein